MLLLPHAFALPRLRVLAPRLLPGGELLPRRGDAFPLPPGDASQLRPVVESLPRRELVLLLQHANAPALRLQLRPVCVQLQLRIAYGQDLPRPCARSQLPDGSGLLLRLFAWPPLRLADELPTQLLHALLPRPFAARLLQPFAGALRLRRGADLRSPCEPALRFPPSAGLRLQRLFALLRPRRVCVREPPQLVVTLLLPVVTALQQHRNYCWLTQATWNRLPARAAQTN